MFRGICFVLLACVIWGLIYLIPQFMPAFSPLEVALGRYGSYGLASLLYMLLFRYSFLRTLPSSIWKKAIGLSLLANIGFYPTAVACMRCSHPAIAALILGMSPITVALYGNWREKECDFSRLIFPCVAMGIGLILVNIPSFEESLFDGSIGIYIFGLISGFISLAFWTIYAVLNGRFLKTYPEIRASDWCSIIGIATLGWIVIFATFYGLLAPSGTLQKFSTFTPELQHFLLWSAVLGLMCSWTAFFFWNKGSARLPISLAGQLTIFETLFGLLYVYSFDHHMPSTLEILGVLIALCGIYVSIRIFKEPETSTEHTAIL